MIFTKIIRGFIRLEQDLLNEVCIPSMLARLDLLQKGYKQ